LKLNKYLSNIAIVLLIASTISTTALAATNGYGAGLGREDVPNINDYSTSSWDRFIYNYQFQSGVNYKEELGTPTQTDIVPRNPEIENIRRDKNTAFIPPPYGYFSGEFDTERSNPYVNIADYNYTRNTTSQLSSQTYDTLQFGINGVVSDTGVLQSTSLLEGSAYSDNISGISSVNNATGTATTSTGASNVTITTNDYNSGYYTDPLEYSDGSIGRLSIDAINVAIKVYEGETNANMEKGAAHFEHTSAWHGNVGICAHNSGNTGYFKNLKKLVIGDEITYSTKYGERTYIVSSTHVISDTDYSLLNHSPQNQITLVTCENGVANQRYVVVAVEK